MPPLADLQALHSLPEGRRSTVVSRLGRLGAGRWSLEAELGRIAFIGPESRVVP